MKRTARRKTAAAARSPAPVPQRPASGLQRFRRPLAVLAVLALALLVLYLARAPLLTAAGRMLVGADRLQKADVALVLGGDETERGERVRAAAVLYKQGWVRKLALSGPLRGFGVYESEMSGPVAASLGVPKDDLIVLQNRARSTLEEASLLLPMLEKRGYRTIYVVTSNFHTARARRIFRDASNGRLQILAWPAPDESFAPENWWHTREGRKTFVIEVLKSVNSSLE